MQLRIQPLRYCPLSRGKRNDPLLIQFHRGYTSVTEITQFLYEKGVDFHQCRDAASLRNLYREVKEDCLQKTKFSTISPETTAIDTAMIPDPHPGMDRHGIDPYELVGEVKIRMCRIYRLDNKQMDLLLNGKVLDDNKRICEYPQTKTFELTLRSKSSA
ncbi:hypothetical protein XU18_0053 [Perkinsela sp. CCAP 1560/4]|nr:hypothetical protein XU18_0053 [Perkinsela sp. CCAP 1560/4]|eukprot:KNH09368.1 hypothetical protein XU18_0053 [Perkinsela sp. CCAP 1560/4]